MGLSYIPPVNLHSPGAIGDVTPSTIAGTVVTSNAVNAGATIVLAGGSGDPTMAGGIFFGVTPTAGNHTLLGNPGNNVTLNGPGGVDVRIAVQLDNIIICSSARAAFSKPVNLQSYTVATLPGGTVGDTAFVTDASTTIILGLGLAAVGGGANKVPVYYDGAWKIG